MTLTFHSLTSLCPAVIGGLADHSPATMLKGANFIAQN